MGVHMLQTLPEITTILNTITAFIVGISSCLAAIALLIKPIRKRILNRISGQKTLEKTVNNLVQEVGQLRSEVREIKDQNATQNDGIKLIKDATLCELRDTLTHMYYSAEKAGGLSHYNKENFEKMYQSYTNLGGNSYVHEIREKVMNMNTVDD